VLEGHVMLSLEGVTKTYQVGAFGAKRLTAVDNVSFDVGEGEVVALIGESGSGKSTLGRMVLRLTGITSGRILFDGKDITRIDNTSYRRIVQGVFQDPFSSYNPIFKADRVLHMIRDAFFGKLGNAEWTSKVEKALDSVRLDAGQVLGRYPHQLSGGQLQRLLIARALLLDIRFLVADELISMLDASTRIDVLNLLAELKTKGLGILFITHDLSLGHYLSDRTVILRHGEVIESGETTAVFASPSHEYTKLMLASVPQLHTKWKDL
jgi:peptide/nickel transport system ATP-binding protein